MPKTKDNESFHNDHREVRIWAVVPAAGVGQRMQAEVPKQYLSIHSKTILELTLQKLLDITSIHKVVVALDKADLYWPGLSKVENGQFTSVVTVNGGNSRQVSVFNALKYIKEQSISGFNDWVLVHDAARPCVSPKKINVLITHALNNKVGTILAAPVTHSVKVSSDGLHLSGSANRDQLWLANTPQFFPLNLLYNCISKANDTDLVLTDEASALEAFNYPVDMVCDRRDNIKITLPEDLLHAEFILEQQNKQIFK